MGILDWAHDKIDWAERDSYDTELTKTANRYMELHNI